MMKPKMTTNETKTTMSMNPDTNKEVAPTKTTMTPEETESERSLAFRQGYYCAVAALVSMHGAGIEAEETLRAYGRVNFRGIDQYDKKKLAPLAKEIRRRQQIAL
jgi:hypothetical protein